MADDLDVIIIGGGPAGLTAGIYLARFHLRTAIIDGGGSRASMIPVSHNQAGHPDGIKGSVLVGRMREQAAKYGAAIIDDTVTAITHTGGVFTAAGRQTWTAPAVLLATGVFNIRPAMPEALHDAAVGSGALRYCPICDGYEVTDRRVAVIGTGERGTAEAVFLRGFTADLTLIAPSGGHDLDAGQRQVLAAAGVALVEGPATDFALVGDGLRLMTAAGAMTFASVYPALGSVVHSQLATSLGAKTADAGCIVVDAHQRTSVPGLYAAGDVVLGLDQISNAMGQGGVASTTIRNDRADRQPLRRPDRRRPAIPYGP